MLAALWTVSNGRCYTPGCIMPVVLEVRPGVYQKKSQVAHIYGVVRPGAPRYRSDMPAGERDPFANLLLLCTAHHEEVDGKDGEDRYPPETLRRWKAQHEGAAGSVLKNLTVPCTDALVRKLIEIAEPPLERLETITLRLDETGTRRLWPPGTCCVPHHGGAFRPEHRQRDVAPPAGGRRSVRPAAAEPAQPHPAVVLHPAGGPGHCQRRTPWTGGRTDRGRGHPRPDRRRQPVVSRPRSRMDTDIRHERHLHHRGPAHQVRHRRNADLARVRAPPASAQGAYRPVPAADAPGWWVRQHAAAVRDHCP